MAHPNPNVIPQYFDKGDSVTIHPCYRGPTGRGIQRNKRYTLTENTTGNTVTFKDDHGFTRYRPLAHFVQVSRW
jgi:hypothetical protein